MRFGKRQDELQKHLKATSRRGKINFEDACKKGRLKSPQVLRRRQQISLTPLNQGIMIFNILKKVVETAQKNPKTTERVFKALQNLANSRQKK